MLTRRSHFTPYFFLIAGVLLQGLSPVFTKLLLADLSQATVVASRYLLAAAFLFPFGRRHDVKQAEAGKPRRRDWVALFLVGLLGSGFGALLFTAAIDYSHAGIANAISKTAPIFVSFLAYFTLRERITWARFFLVLMMVAAALLIGLGELAFGIGVARQHLVGDALALGAGILRAAAEILGKSALRKFTPSTVAMWRFGVGFLLTGLISLGGGQYMGLLQLSVNSWLLVLALAGISTSLSMVLYYRGLSEIPAHVAVTLKLLGAIVTVIVCWIVLGETLNAYHIAGIAVLVFGAYLIVVRTARQQMEEAPVTPEQQAVERVSRPWASSLKTKIAILVSVTVVVTLLSGTYLAIRHTNSVISDHVRLAMGETAYMVLQYQTLGQPPDRSSYQQLLRRLVHHKIQGRVYSVQVLYVILLDGHDGILAYAADPAILRRTEEGKQEHPAVDVVGQQLLDLTGDQHFRGDEGVISLTAELEGYPQVLKMGCRKSIARRAASEITVRYFSLAVLLIIVGILVSTHLSARLVRPLERVTVAASRIAAGDLTVPLVSRGEDEVHKLSDSMARMLSELQMAAMLRKRVFRSTTAHQADEKPQMSALPAVTLVLQLAPPERKPPDYEQTLGGFLDSFIATIFEHEGEIHEYGAGRVVVGWGVDEPERDDVLRATLAGLSCLGLEKNTSADDTCLCPGTFLIDYMADMTPEDTLDLLKQQLGTVLPVCRVYATKRAFVEVAHHFTANSVGDGNFYEITGLTEEQPLEHIATVPDE